MRIWNTGPNRTERVGVGVMADELGDFDPLWRRTASTITQRVTDGTYPAGSKLPAERTLTESLGVSRVTLRKALQTLVDEAVLRASPGRGWFVTASPDQTASPWPNSLESFSDTAARKGLAASSRVLLCTVGEFSLDLADELAVAPGTPCLHLRRLRLMDNVPIGIDDAWINLVNAPGIEQVDFATASLYVELTQRDAAPAQAQTVIEAAEVSAAEAEPLGLPPGAPVLRMRQVVTDLRRRPLMLSSLTYRGDRYRLQTTFARA